MSDDQFFQIVMAVFVVTVTAMLVERVLAFVFDARGIRDFLEASTGRRALKPLISFVLSLIIAYIYVGEQLFAELFPNVVRPDPDHLAIWMTAALIAGGSAGMMTIFQEVLGLSKSAREARRSERQAQTQAAWNQAMGSAGRGRRLKPGGQVGFPS